MRLKMLFGQLVLEMKLFLRDRQSVFWSFFFPVFLILLFGLIFSKPNAIKFNIGLIDEDNSDASRELITTLEQIPVLKIEKSERDVLTKELNDNEKSLVIELNKGFSDSVAAKNCNVTIIYNESNPQVNQIVSSILTQVISGINWKLVGEKPPIQIQQKSFQATKRKHGYIDFLLPGVIAMSVLSTCLFSIGMVVVAYREKGKLRRLSVTPLPKSIFIAGQILNRYFIVLLQAILLIGIGYFVFSVKMEGKAFDFFAALTFGMLTFIALGFFIASISKTTETASGIANTFFLPMMFLSGVYFSVDGAPKFIKPLVEFLPLTHLVRAIRSIFNNGHTFADVLPQMGILFIWMIVFLGLSVKLFKWE